MEKQKTTITFQTAFGRLVRGRALEAIQALALSADVSLTWTEQRGFLDSVFMFRISGDKENVDKFRLSVDRWNRHMQEAWA